MDDSELESLRSKRMAQMQSELGGVSETLELYCIIVIPAVITYIVLLLFLLLLYTHTDWIFVLFSLKAIILRSKNKQNNNVRPLKT